VITRRLLPTFGAGNEGADGTLSGRFDRLLSGQAPEHGQEDDRSDRGQFGQFISGVSLPCLARQQGNREFIVAET
jgi:hypothetical protein